MIFERCGAFELSEDLLKNIKEDFFHRVIFEYLYKEAEAVVGEMAARQLLYKIMKDSSKEAVNKYKDQIMKVVDPNKPCESFKMIYKAFGINDVQCEVKGNKAHLVIRRCPLPGAYDKEKSGRACIVMTAIVAGMVEAMMGKKVYLETPKVRFGTKDYDIAVKMKKNIVMGDPHCEFEAEIVKP